MSARAALYDALAAVTVCDVAWWEKYGPAACSPRARLDFRADEVAVVADLRRPTKHMRTGIYSAAGLRYPSPAEALEALHTRALWPFATEGDGAARWQKFICYECGHADPPPHRCPSCSSGERDWSPPSVRPPSIPALVAVASLGASALLRAASLAEDIARAAGHPKARIVWRVMTRAAIEEHHRKAFDEGAAAGVEYVAASTAGLHRADIGELLAWVDETKGDRAVAERVIALALHEDGTATGVHLVGLDAGAVTLAVEAIS